MSPQLAKQTQAIARPLPVLVPLIQGELTAGNRAGLEHYRRAGEMLQEAREQVATFKWGTWLTKNFALSRKTAEAYSASRRGCRSNPLVTRLTKR